MRPLAKVDESFELSSARQVALFFFAYFDLGKSLAVTMMFVQFVLNLLMSFSNRNGE